MPENPTLYRDARPESDLFNKARFYMKSLAFLMRGNSISVIVALMKLKWLLLGINILI
ncbi:hypothetical protein MKleb_5630 (plasmid) [Klebsiella sp. PL-2018]|nr:hypothetical protein MKleb_5630 [Klebsiella sp. PL-2018]